MQAPKLNRSNLAKRLIEQRPSFALDLISQIGKLPDVEKLVRVQQLSDGAVALVRTTDGNAYEIQIRPAKYAKTAVAQPAPKV